MNMTLAAGDERNGRPLLAGQGSSYESSSARSGTGLPYSAISEAFARTVSVAYEIFNPGSTTLSDFTGSDRDTQVD